MPTTNTTSGSNTSTLSFNPAAQQTYNQLMGSAGSQLTGYINSPFNNPQYNIGAGQSQKGAQQGGANNMQALQQLMRTSGLTGQAGAGFNAAQQAKTGRANQSMSSQANIQNIMSAMQRQQSAIGTGLSFSPQLTGQSGNFNQQQSTGGLGSWLPQLMGGLMGAGLGAATGGSSGFGSGAGAAASMPSGLSSMMSPGTFGGITGMAGMAPGGLANMMPGGGGQTAPNPFASMMQPQY